MNKEQLIALEVKTAKGRVGDHQAHFLEAIRRNGGLAGVVRSADQAAQILGVTPR
jgi:hypothetical protein